MNTHYFLVLFAIFNIKFGNSSPTPKINSANTNGFLSLLRNSVHQGYILFEKSLYKYHRDQQLWVNARKICDAEGGHLVIINTDDEANFVQGLMSKYPDAVLTDVKFKNQALIGMHDFFKDGEFVTIDGKCLESSGYNYWEPGNPSGKLTQNCGSITRTGGLNDFPCETPSPFICEIPLRGFCDNSGFFIRNLDIDIEQKIDQ